MPDTPAMRVGLRPKDHIVRINNESTMNMTLNEEVERLRGDVDTTVEVYVERDGITGMKKFTITRAFIRPPAIDPPARVLARSSAARRAPWPVRPSAAAQPRYTSPLAGASGRIAPERGAEGATPSALFLCGQTVRRRT